MGEQKILFIGIGEQNAPGQRMARVLEKKAIPYVYARWSDLAFVGERLFVGSEEIKLDDVKAVYFDKPRFSLKVGKPGQLKKEIEFNLENELQILLAILKKKQIFAPNGDFFRAHPFYNKTSQAYLFAASGVPSIPTVHLTDNKLMKIEQLLEAQDIKFPLVVKESYGERGDQVWKINDTAELQNFVAQKRNLDLLFQPLIENNADYRVIVINGECAGVMKRSAREGEWKNNYSLGGQVQKHEDLEMEKFAIQACQRMNLDFAGLDIFATPTGYLVIEVNLFFGLDGFESVIEQANVYEKILQLIIDKTKI